MPRRSNTSSDHRYDKSKTKTSTQMSTKGGHIIDKKKSRYDKSKTKTSSQMNTKGSHIIKR